MRVFKSKMDSWLALILLSSLLLCLWIALVTFLQGGMVNLLIAAFIVLTGAGLPLWIFVGTRYLVDKEQLRIISGPFRWNISLCEINSVRETRDPISSPALSLDRLDIDYAKQRHILVSPKNRIEFLIAIGQQLKP